MIPQFPEFKTLELTDKEEVEKFTLKYPPYSDFNFAGTWSWDVRDQMRISLLNNNYVIRFINYNTGEPFYTFLGENKVNETAKELLDFATKEKILPELKLISEEVARKMDSGIFNLEEDRDNFDYIFKLEELKDYIGGKFNKKRNRYKVFTSKYPNAEVKIISLDDLGIQEAILHIYNKWLGEKIESDAEFETHKEIVVLEKFFSVVDVFNIISIGVFVEEKLIAFSINEIMPSEYVVSHVVKTDHDFSGVHEFLIKKSSEMLFSMNKRLLNQEQDLGVPSLRDAKSRFRPAFFLKKYNVRVINSAS
jgi:hypothetical protein